MTVHQFEEQLKKIDKNFNIRQRGESGIGGIFYRNEFIVTLSQGHIPLNTIRYIYKRGDRYDEKIKKRGRAELARILLQRGLLNQDQSVKLKYGAL